MGLNPDFEGCIRLLLLKIDACFMLLKICTQYLPLKFFRFYLCLDWDRACSKWSFLYLLSRYFDKKHILHNISWWICHLQRLQKTQKTHKSKIFTFGEIFFCRKLFWSENSIVLRTFFLSRAKTTQEPIWWKIREIERLSLSWNSAYVFTYS